MPTETIPIIQGEKLSVETDYRDSLPVNMTAVAKPILGSKGYLLSHYGLTSFATAPGVDCGGYWNDRFTEHFRVSGGKFIRVTENGIVEPRGDLPCSGRASMTHSFDNQAIVANGAMWLYDNSTLTQVIDLNLGAPIDITWIDGYFFLTDGANLYHTVLGDEDKIDPLQFSTSTFSPDPTLGVAKTADNQVIVFDRYSTEYFINAATENFAFTRIQGKAIKIGIVGTHCKVEMRDKFYVLGGGRNTSVSAYVISAGNYVSIATREIEKIFATYTENELSSSIVETRTQNKDEFIIFHLIRDTLLYNNTIAETLGINYAWTIVKTDILSDITWRGVNGVFDPRIPAWVYGDKTTNDLGLLDETVATQYGNNVETIIYTPLLYLDDMSLDQVEIETIPGHQSSSDKVICFISLTYDGLTYSKEFTMEYGSPSDVNLRFIIRRLGYVRHFVGFKIRCAGPDRLSFAAFKLTYG